MPLDQAVGYCSCKLRAVVYCVEVIELCKVRNFPENIYRVKNKLPDVIVVIRTLTQ